MQKFLQLSAFHMKLFLRNSYFVSTMVVNTVSILLLEYIVSYISNGLDSPFLWVRAGIFGLWGSAVTAAGAITFQRFQGTLPYLLNTATSDLLSLAALITPSSAFGLLAFPLSFSISWLLGLNVSITLSQLAAIPLLWLGALVMDFGIAAFFVRTPNALVYEELIFIPVMLLGGLFEAPSGLQFLIDLFGWVLPISAPIRMLLSGNCTGLLLAQFVVSTGLCWCVSVRMAQTLLRNARRNGTMGVSA